eukprot:3743627-Alexandrium_andersonii.AAC.1
MFPLRLPQAHDAHVLWGVVVVPPWPEHDADGYFEWRNACEVTVTIRSEEERTALYSVGGLRFDKRSNGFRGLSLQRPVPQL